MADLALFDIDGYEPPTERVTESPGVRRTRRQLGLLARGLHPLSSPLGRPLPLHVEAAPHDDRSAPGRRCGNCRFRRVIGHRAGSYPKCVRPGDGQSAESYDLDGPPRVSHGEATDCRGWWSACRDHEPGDRALPDGMRWVPDPKEMR